MNCEWIQHEGQVKCSACGAVRPTARNRNCPVKLQGPPLTQRLWNVTQAMGAFVSDGFRLVDRDTYQSRLETCDACEKRKNDWCMECGCKLAFKARGRAFTCPLNKWGD